MNGKNYVAWNWNAGDTDGKTYTVTVVSDSGNKYRFDAITGTSAVTLDLAEGGTYTFDQSDSSMSSHPMQDFLQQLMELMVVEPAYTYRCYLSIRWINCYGVSFYFWI